MGVSPAVESGILPDGPSLHLIGCASIRAASRRLLGQARRLTLRF